MKYYGYRQYLSIDWPNKQITLFIQSEVICFFFFFILGNFTVCTKYVGTIRTNTLKIGTIDLDPVTALRLNFK